MEFLLRESSDGIHPVRIFWQKSDFMFKITSPGHRTNIFSGNRSDHIVHFFCIAELEYPKLAFQKVSLCRKLSSWVYLQSVCSVACDVEIDKIEQGTWACFLLSKNMFSFFSMQESVGGGEMALASCRMY